MLVQPVTNTLLSLQNQEQVTTADGASALHGHSMAPGALPILIQQQPVHPHAVVCWESCQHFHRESSPESSLLWWAVTAEDIFDQGCMVLFVLSLSETSMPNCPSTAPIFQGKPAQIYIVQVPFIDQVGLLQSRSSVTNTKNYVSDEKVEYWI